MLKAQAGPDQSDQQSDQDEEIDLGAWVVTEDSVRLYTQAVGDSLPLYFQSQHAPPLALAAWALGRLLTHMKLPPGAIHSLQEIETLRAVQFGESVSASVQISKPRRRGGLEFITAAYSIRSDSPRLGSRTSSLSQQVLTGKTTVLIPQEGSDGRNDPASPQRERPESRDASAPPATDGFTPVERTIDQPSLDAYAVASGDFNPLHLDPEFAATTRFGGIVAHGMLTLALISESMAGTFGGDWLESGAMKVRFKGAAYLGDRLATRCRVVKEEPADGGRRATCSAVVINTANAQELISGTASVILASVNPVGEG